MSADLTRVVSWLPVPCCGPEAQLFVIGDVPAEAEANFYATLDA